MQLVEAFVLVVVTLGFLLLPSIVGIKFAAGFRS
jgi:hypothetical protein